MILTSAFLICKALGASWSWWWLVATIVGDTALCSEAKTTTNGKKKHLRIKTKTKTITQ